MHLISKVRGNERICLTMELWLNALHLLESMINILLMFSSRSMPRWDTVWLCNSFTGIRPLKFPVYKFYFLMHTCHLICFLAAWWFEFNASCWTFSLYSFGIQGSHHNSWDGRITWLSRPVWYTINCCGNKLSFSHLLSLHVYYLLPNFAFF